MAAVINTNVASLNSQRQLNKSQSSLNTALERLSSGLRINSAKDDAAGLAISARMTSQINGMDQATRNANDGISMSQTAEGALSTASDLLQRIRTLAVQSSNSSNSSSDRQAIQSEVSALTSELDRIATSTQFNGQNLLDGTGGTLNYQVGANANQTISTSTANFRTTNYGDNRVSTDAAAVSATAFATATAGTVSIDGYLGSKDVATGADASAEDIATAINQATTDTGVTASARTTANVALEASSSFSIDLTSNNSTAITISFSTGSDVATADGYANAVSAINAATSKTGVSAEYDSSLGGIKLTNASGANLTLTANASSTGTVAVDTYSTDLTTDVTTLAGTAVTSVAGTASDAKVTGTVTLDSQQSFSVSADTSGLRLNTGGSGGAGASDLKAVSDLDVTTYDNAQLAISIVDSALASVDNQLAQYGATQNRFTSVVSNLQSSSENLSSSRSRIQDADFASETSEMSKANILQQAGTAMLAQANSSTQNVLTLLK